MGSLLLVGGPRFEKQAPSSLVFPILCSRQEQLVGMWPLNPALKKELCLLFLLEATFLYVFRTMETGFLTLSPGQSAWLPRAVLGYILRDGQAGCDQVGAQLVPREKAG